MLQRVWRKRNPHWWECKLVQSLRRTVGMSFRKLKMQLPYVPAISLLDIYLCCCCSVTQFVQLFVIPWTAAKQDSLSLPISWSLSKFMSIALVMPSSHLIFWCPLLLLPSIFPRIRDFSNELAVRIRWPKY